MVENAPEVERYFAERHIRLKRDWLLEALHFVSAEKCQNRLVDLVYQQWLFADIKTSTEPIDGLRQLFDGRSLYDPYVFQIHSISDIGTSNLKQYKRLTDPSYEEPIEYDQPNPNSAGGYSCFSLQLSDGVVELKAFEKKKVPDLTISTCPGSKILIYGSVKLCHGYIFLAKDNCQLLGGAVEHLMRINNVVKTLSELLNKPMPQTNTETAIVQPNQEKKLGTAPLQHKRGRHSPEPIEKTTHVPTPQQQKRSRQSPEPLEKTTHAPTPQQQKKSRQSPEPLEKTTHTPTLQQQKKSRQSPEPIETVPVMAAPTTSLEQPESKNEDDACRYGKKVANFLRRFGPRKQLMLTMKFDQLMLENMPED